MEINNIQGLTVAQIKNYVNQGGKFVYYPYTISIVVMTFQRNSDIYFIKPGEGSFGNCVGFFFINILLGWWGIPWGPIYTIGALYSQLTGGKDITQEILSHLIQNDPDAPTNTYNIPGTNNTSSTQPGNSPYNIPNSGNATGSPYNIPNSNSGNSTSSPYNIR